MRKRIWTLSFTVALAVPLLAPAQSPVDSLLEVFRANPDDSLKWIALFHVSQHYAKENTDSALAWAQRGLEFAQQKAPYLTPRSLNNVGLQHMNKGNFDRALEFYLQALEAARQYNCQPCIATTTGNMGIIAWNKKEYDKAETYFREAIALMQALKDTVGQARYLNNLGLVQLDKSRVDEAEHSYQTALQLLDAADTICFQPIIYNNLGNIAYARGRYPQALEFYRQSSVFAEKMNDDAAAFLGLNNSGWAHLAMKNYDEAINNFLQGKVLAEKVKNDRNIEMAVGALADAYKAKGDFQNAFSHLEKYLQIHDTIAARLNNKAVMELETRYLTQQKEAELARQQLAFQQQTSEKRLILGAALFAILALLGLSQYLRNRQKIKQKEAELALQLEHAEAEKLRELDQVKSSFFANISHEFRTPLTLIAGPVKKWLSQNGSTDTLSVPVREAVVLQRNADRLLELVNQLLDLSKLESGRMKLSVARDDLGQTLRVLAHTFDSMAEHSDISYRIEAPETTEMAWFDRDKIGKIISNLLSNAFKHTPPGGTVAFAAHIESDRLTCSITDTGPGIPPHELEKIFDRFYQVEGSGDKGTGIGLALVKELVALHRGHIRVQNKPGEGASFTVELPVGAEAFDADEKMKTSQAVATPKPTFTEEAVTIEAAETATAEQRPLCLIVEDNRDVQDFIREQLESDFRILLAKNGRDGLQSAIEQIPDLIVSDVMMPEMDGNQLCAALKTDERTSHIPVILLTAKADQASRISGLETGADDYLTKPFDSRELLVRAQNLVSQREKLRKQFSRTVVLKPQEIALTSADERFLQRIQESLDANLGNEQFSVEELASAVGMSRSQLHRKLTALIDQPPVEFIRNFRLRRAKEMLEAGTGNVSEIGYEVGFSSAAYFSKAFKDAFGVSPSEVRK